MPSFGACSVRRDNERFVIEHYERLGIPVALGRDERDASGRFARTRAINAAARIASRDHPTRPAFILCDNDLIPDQPALETGLALLSRHCLVTPHAQTLLLDERSRAEFMRSGRVTRFRAVRSGSRSYVLILASTFSACNGMDEVFAGWGPEDGAFVHSVTKQTGAPALFMSGQRVHLWHPVDPTRADAENVRRLMRRRDAYARANQSEAARLAREYGRWDRESRCRDA